MAKSETSKYSGLDNNGKPKQDFLDKLKSLNDTNLGDECERYIWLSAYAGNNPRSDFHWMCDACYDETVNRNKVEIYESAYQVIKRELLH
jgi:hypothetical protein